MIRDSFRKDIINNKYEIDDSKGIYLPKHRVTIGGIFTNEVYRDGNLIMLPEESHNIVVNEGLNHVLDVVLHNSTQVATWYVGIFKGNYTPLATDTAANITSNSTEATEYDETTRVEYIYHEC